MTCALTLKPRRGFDWRRIIWGWPDTRPPTLCSYCAGALPPVPLMLLRQDGRDARFCDECVRKWWRLK